MSTPLVPRNHSLIITGEGEGWGGRRILGGGHMVFRLGMEGGSVVANRV